MCLAGCICMSAYLGGASTCQLYMVCLCRCAWQGVVYASGADWLAAGLWGCVLGYLNACVKVSACVCAPGNMWARSQSWCFKVSGCSQGLRICHWVQGSAIGGIMPQPSPLQHPAWCLLLGPPSTQHLPPPPPESLPGSPLPGNPCPAPAQSLTVQPHLVPCPCPNLLPAPWCPLLVVFPAVYSLQRC